MGSGVVRELRSKQSLAEGGWITNTKEGGEE